MSVVDEQFGSDANDGSFKKPFGSIDHAFAVRQPHETIIIFHKPLKESEYITGRKTFEIKEEITTA